MLSELAIPHIRCCFSAIPSDLMKSTVMDESLSSMNQQFCSKENQLLQVYRQLMEQFIHRPNENDMLAEIMRELPKAEGSADMKNEQVIGWAKRVEAQRT